MNAPKTQSCILMKKKSEINTDFNMSGKTPSRCSTFSLVGVNFTKNWHKHFCDLSKRDYLFHSIFFFKPQDTDTSDSTLSTRKRCLWPFWKRKPQWRKYSTRARERAGKFNNVKKVMFNATSVIAKTNSTNYDQMVNVLF